MLYKGVARIFQRGVTRCQSWVLATLSLSFLPNAVGFVLKKGLGHPLFFLCLVSSDQPKFSHFQKKKKVTRKAMKAMTHSFEQFLL